MRAVPFQFPLVLLFVLVVLAALFAGGCAHHLGPDHGVAYVNAFVAQAEVADAPAPAPLDAADAERVLAKHRGVAPANGAGPGAAAAVPLLLPVPR